MLFGIDLKTLEALKCAGNTPAWYASELATGFTTALPEDLILTAFQTRGKLPESFEAPAVPAGIQEMSAEAHAFALRWWLALKADAERAPYTSCLRYAVSLSVAHAAAEIPTVDLLAFIGHCPQAWQLRYPGSFVIREAEELKTLRGSTDDRIELARQSTHEARAIERYQQMLYLAQSGISAVRAALPVSDWGAAIQRAWRLWKEKGGHDYVSAPDADPLILPKLSDEEKKVFASRDAREESQARVWLEMTEARVAGTLGGMPAAKLKPEERQALYGALRFMAGFLMTTGLSRYQIMAVTGCSQFAIKKIASFLTDLGYTVSNAKSARSLSCHGSASVRMMAALQIHLWGCIYAALSGGKSVDRINITSFLLAMDVWKRVVFPVLGMKHSALASEFFDFAQQLRMTGLKSVGVCVHCGSVILPTFGSSEAITDAEQKTAFNVCPVCAMRKTGRFVNVAGFDPGAAARGMREPGEPRVDKKSSEKSGKTPAPAAKAKRKPASTLRKSASKNAAAAA